MIRVAVLGLGAMGAPMARNLLAKGYPVTVWNRTPARAAVLARAGAAVAHTPAQAAREADLVITMLADPAAVGAVAEGSDGVLAGAPAGAIWVECSTIGATAARRFAGLARAAGLAWLDAPVSGSVPQAENGTLRFFVGGDATVLEQVRPVLEAMGQIIIHCGPTGHGAAAKLVNNLLVGAVLAALSEARALGMLMELNPEVLLQVLATCAGTGPFLQGKLPAIAAGRYEPVHFSLQLMEKDLGLALFEGAGGALPMPVSAAAHGAYGGARAAGLGDLDVSALARYAELLGGRRSCASPCSTASRSAAESRGQV